MEDIVGGEITAGKSTSAGPPMTAVATARQARARARAVYEFEAMHDSPEHWEPWERAEFAAFVEQRTTALLRLSGGAP